MTRTSREVVRRCGRARPRESGRGPGAVLRVPAEPLGPGGLQEQATPELEETEKISMGEISVREAHMLVE